ncbi:MAG: aquaporin family protein [Betaproteobacteria bacterium]|jgi:glycerol uptake facilitator-like aquaporin|nr:aquaporin family protein [Betaproteobacteria bacterium]NCX68755.1 aquaporin family protein [Betaproteobacteria bacterium]
MQKYVSEFLGTFILLLCIVGSGIAGQQYTDDQMVILLSHAVVIGFTLIFLIRIFANYSGAHFNPIVSLLFFFKGELPFKDLVIYTVIQCVAGILGTLIANFLFGLSVIEISSNIRSGHNIYISEIFSTFGLLMVILLSRADGKNIVAFNVGIYICAAIIFTSSASFANPAVTIARMFTESFAGIHPSTILFFIGSQVIGLGIAYSVFTQVFEKKS